MRQITGRSLAIVLGDDVLDMIKDLKVVFGKGRGEQSVLNDADRRAPM